MNDLSQKEIKNLFLYDHLTGVITRRVSVNGSNGKKGAEVGVFKDGYLIVHVKGKQYRLHRIAWVYVNGSIAGEIDHINGDRSDNRISNLRCVSRQENNKNRALPRNNTSGLIGVSLDKSLRWEAYITAWNIKKKLGRFDNLFDAACGRKSAELRLGFHDNHGARCA